MDEIQSAEARRRRKSRAPAVESLEGRRLLAASPTLAGVKEVTQKGYTELDLSTTARGGSVAILDNGSAAPGNVTVTFGDGTSYTAKAGVSVVKFQGGSGADNVQYRLTGALTTPRSVIVNLGNGSNKFTGEIAGAIQTSSGLDLEVFGGSGNDAIVVNQSGPTLSGAFVPYLSGGGGKNVLAYTGSGPIAANSSVSPEIAGGPGVDAISLNYAGRVDGNYLYNLTVAAGSGTETITNDIFLSWASSGRSPVA